MAPETTETLLERPRSPDPHQRHEVAFEQLAERIGAGELDVELTAIGDRLAERLDDPEAYARSFAALVLAEVVDRDRQTGVVDGAAFDRWCERALAWYRAEPDQRGWDDSIGWVHAIAHGADLLGAFGRSPRLGAPQLNAILDTAANRLVQDGSPVWVDQEGDRLAYGLASVLTRPELDEAAAVGWFEPVRAALEQEHPRRPAWAMNASGTLRLLYLLAERGFTFPDGQEATIGPRAALLEALAGLIRRTWPYLG